MTKFCSTFHEILAFKQNTARKQEVGHCDLIIDFFFILIILKNEGATNALYKILAGSGGKVDFSGLATVSNSRHI